MSNSGKVYLVGGGPGDPGLLTLKGQACLQQADLVLYDGLVNPLLLRHSSATAQRTCRSDCAGTRRLNQDEINSRLVEAARAGKCVVRLKGGDPFIFGRGSEEAAALAAAGIEFEVVPGVTSATAAGAYAGLSLTHRKHASAVAFVTGHEDPTKPESHVDYGNLAAFSGTLVFYMGLHRLPAIADQLIACGKSPDTPSCVISRATTPLQQTVSSPLGELAGAVMAAQLHAPSLIIIGECVQQREQIAWFEKRPLLGQHVGITRPIAQADNAIDLAFALGASPVLMPAIQVSPETDYEHIDAALRRLDQYDALIFTSVNGVRSFFDRLWQLGYDTRALGHLQVTAIGSSTADLLAGYHVRADIVPDDYRAESLAAALKPLGAATRFLWPRASRGRDVLIDELASIGASVDPVVFYHNVDASTLPEDALQLIREGRLDWIGLSSPSIARSIARLIPDDLRKQFDRTVRVATISPVTSAAARAVGLTVAAEATTYTWQGIFDAIIANG